MMEGVHSRRQHMGNGGGPEKYKGVGR